MSIFMTHPEHGSANVMEGDVEANQKNGWIVDTFEAWAERVKPKDNVQSEITKRSGVHAANLEDVDIDILRIAYKEKFGKAAHHKKTAEWLRGELA